MTRRIESQLSLRGARHFGATCVDRSVDCASGKALLG